MHERNAACTVRSAKTAVCRIFSCPCRRARVRAGVTALFEDCLGRPTVAPPALAEGKLERAARESARQRAKGGPQAASLPVVIGSGSHPFPFRTRKLSLIPPMVLYGKLYGRVGRCRHYIRETRQPACFTARGLLCVREIRNLESR